ncbi:MAG TPA: DEAD/DEAH box helicase [Tepidisphaeraceae bacterium]
MQRQLWRMGWKELRQLQVDAIRLLLQTQDHLVLCAATASGKTEAAFLPILSQIAEAPSGSVRALYIGPLKALINDQFMRVQELCEHLDVPVHSWHGDVSASRKEKLVKDPGGVLLITPESLESVFVNRSPFLKKLFGGLQFIVIDELHSFLDNERGLHLRSLLCRLQLLDDAHKDVRRVGLSATIGDVNLAKKYLFQEHPERVHVVDDKTIRKETKLKVHGYRSRPREDEDEAKLGEMKPTDEMLRLAADVVKHCNGTANLVFANAKGDVEEYAELCRQHARQNGLQDLYLVHHGSLSAEIREDTESTMKAGARATTFCSSTLEMGIDIGSVKMVGQIGAPWSVAALKQRMGRSGRKDTEARILRLYLRCREPQHDSDLFDRLHLHLVQAIAITELMLDGWVEPPSPPNCDLSTLTQQIISVIAQMGGTTAARIYQTLCASGAFADIGPILFQQLLDCLIEQDVIEQMSEGDLILGLEGERIRKDAGFYAVFQTPQEFAVLHEGRRIGKLQCAPERDEHLLFAGRRWLVTEVDQKRLELHVIPASGWKRPRFAGGVGEIHPQIRIKMRELLTAGHMPAYLDTEAATLLQEAREAAAATKLGSTRSVVLGPTTTALMTWTGSRIQRTLRAMFALHGVDAQDEGIALVFKLPARAVAEQAKGLLGQNWQTRALAQVIEPRHYRKYDELLDDDLIDESVIRDRLDAAGAKETLAAIVRDGL